ADDGQEPRPTLPIAPRPHPGPGMFAGRRTAETGPAADRIELPGRPGRGRTGRRGCRSVRRRGRKHQRGLGLGPGDLAGVQFAPQFDLAFAPRLTRWYHAPLPTYQIIYCQRSAGDGILLGGEVSNPRGGTMRWSALLASVLITLFVIGPPPLGAQNEDKEIGGKKLKQWITDINKDPDPSARELAIRAVTQYGKEGRKAGKALINAMRDTDVN